MPEYVYGCKDKSHPRVICVHGMMQLVHLRCYVCGEKMARLPQRLSINWNGLRPSQGEISDEIKQHIEDAPRRRDQMTPHKSDKLAALEKQLDG